IHSFLKHSLFVSQDHLRSFDVDQTLQTIISDNNSSVKVIQIGSRKTTTIQRNQWTQFRWNNWNHTNDHPFRTIFDPSSSVTECFYYFQSFKSFCLSLLRSISRCLV